MHTQRWREVGSFDPPGALADVDTSAAGTGARRFQSDRGECALLVPVQALGAGDAALHAPPGVAHLLFVDPPDGAAAESLGAALADAASVRVALPAGADPAGLVAETGAVRIGPAWYELFRLPDRPAGDDQRTPSWDASTGDAARIGEPEGSLEGRQRWFGSREGGA